MQIQFERLLYTLDPEFNASKKLDTDEIFAFINKAERQYIKDNFLYGKTVAENAEILKKNSDLLRRYISQTTISLSTLPVGSPENAKDGVMDNNTSTNYDAFISAIAMNLTRTQPFVFSGKNVECKVIEPGRTDMAISSNGYNSPLLINPMIEFYTSPDNRIRVYFDNYCSLSYIKLTYLSKPSLISGTVDCKLPDHLHERIVEDAVKMFLTYKGLVRDESGTNAI